VGREDGTLLNDWVVPILASVAASGIASWQQLLTGPDIIPNYYQPRASVWAFVFAVVCIMLTIARFKKASVLKLNRMLAILLLIIAMISAVIAFLNLTLGYYWDPIGMYLVFVRMLFVGCFIMLVGSVASFVTLFVVTMFPSSR
jgi:hypothetical protein